MTEPEPQNSACSVVLHCEDPEEAMVRVGEVLYPHQLTGPASPQSFRADVTGMVTGPMVASRVTYGGVTGIYCPHVDDVHVNLVLSGRLLSVSSGRSTLLTPGNAVAYDAGTDAELLVGSSDFRFDVLAVRLDRAVVHSTLQDLLGHPVPQPVILEGELDLHSANGRAWRALLVNSYRHRLTGSFLANPRLFGPMTHLIVAGLLSVAHHRYSEELTEPAAKVPPRHVHTATDFIEADPRAPLAPESIARHVGVSVRVLQRSFREHLSCTPMQYVRYCRLRGARAELAASATRKPELWRE